MAAERRDTYTAIATQAQMLYDQGAPPGEALRQCYGVDLPDEIFIIADSELRRRAPSIRFPIQPWRLIPRPGSIEIPREPTGSDSIEKELFRRDSDLFPLAFLTRREARHGDVLVCYRMSELAAGRHTVHGVPGVTYRVPASLDVRSALISLGSSLLTVLHEYFTDIFESLEAEADKERAWGTDAIDDESLDRAKGFVDLIEELLRRSRT
ncbi:hypothetical protein ACFYPF_13260 [Micromonospora sp. NPDC005223]|uniref:hypothetical protein n=1 Tax=unclassified Micromonospora TaxID=2617518 RepID=UPI0034026ED3